jgi:prephenate dehydratase
MRVAFQGAHGAFSEAAARLALGGDIETVPCRTFLEVARAVRAGRVDRGVLPLFNTIAGAVKESHAALEGEALEVLGGVELPIEQCLLVVPGASVADVRRVISHPVALAQCSDFLAAHPAIEAVPAWDTAGAAREVAERGDPALAAIAARLAAERYGLEVAVAGVGGEGNWTRFAVVGVGEGG